MNEDAVKNALLRSPKRRKRHKNLYNISLLLIGIRYSQTSKKALNKHFKPGSKKSRKYWLVAGDTVMSAIGLLTNCFLSNILTLTPVSIGMASTA